MSQASAAFYGHEVAVLRGVSRRTAESLDRVITKDQNPAFALGAADFALARDGALLYLSGSSVVGAAQRTLVWVDRQGHETPIAAPPHNYVYPRLSPDGRRLIFTETNPKTGPDVMQAELDGTHRVTPLVQSPFTEGNGIISPDGRWLAYEANDSGRSGRATDRNSFTPR